MSSDQKKLELKFDDSVSKAARDELIAELEDIGWKISPKKQQVIPVDPNDVYIALKIIAAGFTATKAGLEIMAVINNWRKRRKDDGQSGDVEIKE